MFGTQKYTIFDKWSAKCAFHTQKPYHSYHKSVFDLFLWYNYRNNNYRNFFKFKKLIIYQLLHLQRYFLHFEFLCDFLCYNYIVMIIVAKYTNIKHWFCVSIQTSEKMLEFCIFLATKMIIILEVVHKALNWITSQAKIIVYYSASTFILFLGCLADKISFCLDIAT